MAPTAAFLVVLVGRLQRRREAGASAKRQQGVTGADSLVFARFGRVFDMFSIENRCIWGCF